MPVRLPILTLVLWLSSGGLLAQSPADSSASRYPQGHKQAGLQDVFLAWEGMVSTNEPIYRELRLGLRVGYFLADGWVSGASMTWQHSYPDWPRPYARRWTLPGLFTRYYLLHRNKWTPYGELSVAYATINHDAPEDTVGAGALLLPRAGLSLRINDTWSADVGVQLPLPLDRNGDATLAAGVVVKGGLWLHW